jgi:glycosyltransferase involved in cell wall biosynthesis
VSEPASTLVILTPVHDDWVALGMLLERLDGVLAEEGLRADVVAVDDGSTAEPDRPPARGPYRAIGRVTIVRLRRNLGHQRAIAIGLAYLESATACATVVVMDSDGEDDPRDVPRLVAAHREDGGRSIVFAERTRRSESLGFQAGYAVYRLGHRILTGYRVRFGNFSVLDRRHLRVLTGVSELWNHYAAAVVRARLPYRTIPTQRARRLHGSTRMNVVSLVTHGLSAISVYSEIVGVRLVLAALVVMGLILVGLAAAVGIRLATDLAIPGWATTAVGILLLLLFQTGLLALVFSFVILSGRNGTAFLPFRDHGLYIERVDELEPGS